MTSSAPKTYLGSLGKSLIAFLGLKAKSGLKAYKKARYAITNISMKDFSNIIWDFQNCVIKVMRLGGPNMIPLIVTFT